MMDESSIELRQEHSILADSVVSLHVADCGSFQAAGRARTGRAARGRSRHLNPSRPLDHPEHSVVWRWLAVDWRWLAVDMALVGGRLALVETFSDKCLELRGRVPAFVSGGFLPAAQRGKRYDTGIAHVIESENPQISNSVLDIRSVFLPSDGELRVFQLVYHLCEACGRGTSAPLPSNTPVNPRFHASF